MSRVWYRKIVGEKLVELHVPPVGPCRLLVHVPDASGMPNDFLGGACTRHVEVKNTDQALAALAEGEEVLDRYLAQLGSIVDPELVTG